MLETPSLFASQEPAHRGDDIGYVLGWFCGGILALGVVVAVVYLVQGSPRKAFQAVALPVTYLAWFFLILGIGLWADPQKDSIGEAIALGVLIAGLLFLPILGVYVLRKLPWPPARKTVP